MRRWGSLAFLALVVLVGCANRTTQQDKADTLCNSVAAMDGSVTKLAALTSTATVAQVKSLKTQLDSQYRAVQQSAKSVDGVKIDAVTKAYNEMVAAVAPINTQAALVAAMPNIGTAAGDFSAARLQVNTDGGC